jgi:aspartate-semialdehyde dehydrogenase
MKIAVIGASGLVGRTMLKVLKERGLANNEIIAVASKNSIGQHIPFNDGSLILQSIEQALSASPDISLFSAGGAVSMEWAKRFVEQGSWVIDNSSTWRMKPEVALVVPEINASSIGNEKTIIANPNCSTIQLVTALNKVQEVFGIKRLIVSTYQSVSGSGAKGEAQLLGEREVKEHQKLYPHQIDQNCLPHCDDFLENDYTKEEMKLVNETCKIFNDPSIMVSATAVRVPVLGAHSEAVNVETRQNFQIESIKSLIAETPGVVLFDNPREEKYPMAINAMGKDDVFVGRVRRDETVLSAFNCWIVADNLRKGAATNAVQIAEHLIEKGLV